MSTYHPDTAINATVAAEAMDAEVADVRAGYAPRRWTCDCGASHSRGFYPPSTYGMHRCLRCGYVGSSGTLADLPGAP